jgi:hypothetical protein
VTAFLIGGALRLFLLAAALLILGAGLVTLAAAI